MLPVDCNVHCVPTRAQLMPYLSDYWQETLDNTAHPNPSAVTVAYPDWNEAVRAPSADLTLASLQSGVLARASHAILNCYYGVECFTHPYRAAATATAVNRWLAEQWLDQDDRLRATAVVTPHFPDMAVREIERIAEDGRFVQVMLPARAPAGYGHQQYWPILRAAARHGLHVAITFGGGTGTPPTPVGWPGSYFEDYCAMPLAFQSHVISLVMSGIFRELPDLRIVLVEGGWTWLPPVMWRMDQEWKAVKREVPWVEEFPSSYVRRHFRLTTQPFDGPTDARHLAQLMSHLDGEHMLMFATDHPHVHELGNDDLLRGLEDSLRERVSWGNAAELYGLAPTEG